MNGRFQMQGGKNWFLPKEMNANRFKPATLIGWKSGQTTFIPLWDRMEGAWLWTLRTDPNEFDFGNFPYYSYFFFSLCKISTGESQSA
jgi:hypothetical protein